MTFPTQMTEAQKRMAYRAAVQASLEEFYGKPAPESRALVTAWWNRLSETSAFTSGFFMHSEPINTAARIAHKEVVEINADNEAVYDRLLRRSTHLLDGKSQGKHSQEEMAGKAIARKNIQKHFVEKGRTLSGIKIKAAKATRIKELSSTNS